MVNPVVIGEFVEFRHVAASQISQCLSKASSSAMPKAGKPQSCSVKGDPGERRLTLSKVASWYQLDSLSVGTSSNIMIFMENFHEFSGKPQRIAISMSVSQDDQHKEAELGELKSLMSDEYFRVGIPDGHRCGPMGCGTACLTMTQLVAFQSPRLVDGSACRPHGICWKGTMPLTAGELGYGRPGIAFRVQTWHLAFPSTFGCV